MKRGVVILGGGIAGLSAANLLAQNDLAVTILEAKNRLGGRIHTVHQGGLPVELGAEFLHGKNAAVSAAIQAAGLTTHPAANDHLLLENGKLKRVKFWDKMTNIINHIDPRQPDCSFQEFLATRKLKERERALAIGFVQGFHAAHIDRIGVHSLRRGEYAAEQMQGDSQGRINEGYGALVDFLERENRVRGVKIILNATARAVGWKSKQVEIEFHGEKQKASQRVEANAAIITLPLGVLKPVTVEFHPRLGDKQEAIDQLQFGNVVKIILVFRARWWPENMGFVQSLDEPIPTWWTDPRGPVLTGWAGGPKADALAHYSRSELERLALEICGRIFPVEAASARAELVTAHSHNWVNDPHTRGAYSYIPVNGLDLPKLLAAPIHDTLFFAGEATIGNAQTGTVFGAFESGLRAAREIMDGQDRT